MILHPELLIKYADTLIYFLVMSGREQIYTSRMLKTISMHIFHLYVGILYPSGGPILLHLRRCSLLAVDTYSFAGYFLSATAPDPA